MNFESMIQAYEEAVNKLREEKKAKISEKNEKIENNEIKKLDKEKQ